MEAWFVVKRFVIGLFILGFSVAHSSHAADIRFYKKNKHEQNDRFWISKKKSTQTGCNNFRGAPRIFQIVQVGFQSCSIYSEKNCVAESLIKARHDGADTYSKNLSEGLGWHPSIQNSLNPVGAHPRGVKLRSWNCQ